MTTREKILEEGKKLFNEVGFGTPTLHTLAQRIGISRGNLTYYFKDKEAILTALVDEMWLEYELLIGRTMQFPSWSSTYKATAAFLEFQKKYSFIFFDMKVVALPKVATLIARMKSRSTEQTMTLISFSIELGNMKEENIPGTYKNLCDALWMIQFYWIPSEPYRGKNSQTTWDRLIWSAILPHFTEKGKQAFIQRFGKEYYQSLGDAYNHKKQQDVNF